MRHGCTAAMIVVLWLGSLGARNALGQQASSFEQLQVLVKPGEQIEVVDNAGNATKGKLESLTTGILRLKSKGNFREFTQRETIEVRNWKDSLANGAWIGAAVGGGFGVGSVIAYCNGGWCNSGDVGNIAAVIGVYTGLGAGVGVGIDALFHSRHTIYLASRPSTVNNVRVAPLIGGGRKDIAVRVSF